MTRLGPDCPPARPTQSVSSQRPRRPHVPGPSELIPHPAQALTPQYPHTSSSSPPSPDGHHLVHTLSPSRPLQNDLFLVFPVCTGAEAGRWSRTDALLSSAGVSRHPQQCPQHGRPQTWARGAGARLRHFTHNRSHWGVLQSILGVLSLSRLHSSGPVWSRVHVVAEPTDFHECAHQFLYRPSVCMCVIL